MIIPIDIQNGADIADEMKHFIIQNAERFKRDPWFHENIQYNIFTFPGAFVYLYHSLKTEFYTNGDKIGIDTHMPYYIKGWINVYHKNEKIPWHQHNDTKWPGMYHGVFCIESAGESYTVYEDGNDVESINGGCHIINDMTTKHTSTENLSDELRITLAFDIVGLDYYKIKWDNPNNRPSVNQYIPFV